MSYLISNYKYKNADIFDFKLSNTDMKMINGFHGKFGLATNPDTATW
ncbi:hypothetical protein [Lentilactobacillus rapi]|uniref:Uncharacterized protein n=1 Tax=Lentilactobacillus rapi TaxID=481723 RepID=A0A512PPM5_9LACO|nr:hypothetical protein [Lentilactobacillus rapi]GEP73140.1 hypothetical protein LRA02_20080 [Lentilactobacillus rapi]